MTTLTIMRALPREVNQIGTVTESIRAALDSKAASWGLMVSHRSGETEDNFIADLSVGLLAKGHVFNIEAGKQALRNINSLALFSNIEVNPRADEKNEGGIVVEIKLKEFEQKSAEVSTEWSLVPGRNGWPALASIQPGGTVTFEHRNIKGLNRSIVGSVTSSNLLNPQLEEEAHSRVINHGITEEVIDDMMKAGREFFEMPMEDKARYYSEDPKDNPRLFTGQGGVGEKEGSLYWRDCLIMFSYPVEKFQHRFPEKPAKFRDAVSKLTPEVKGMATRILKLISIGLGLDEDYLTGNRSDGPINMILNYYPPCPDPTLTLGLSKHCDPNLITLLLQGKVSGLQVVHDDKWVSVEPVPNAFVINFGLLLEVMTNGLIKAVEHRAVTNPNVPRTSIALNMISTVDCMICPAPKLVNDQNPPLYGSFLYPDFFKIFLEKKHADKETMMENFRIKK